ncbi:hypothetical protein [Nocardia sp. NPDC003979]
MTREVESRLGRHRNLVILRAGDSSLHESWLTDRIPRTWDFVVSYFGTDPDRYRADDIVRLDRPGPKWPALHHVLTVDLAGMLDHYDYVWLPDDDLATDTATINAMFDYAAAYHLALSQPALTEDSYYTHEITVVDRRFELRYTNFVEIMAPCFRHDFLLACLPTFNGTQTGWGLDFHWPRLLPSTESLAIIDATPLRHTRPIGGPNLTAARATGVDPFAEYHEYLRDNGIDDLTTTVLRGVGDGRRPRGHQPTAICATIDAPNAGLRTWLDHHARYADLLIVYSDDPAVRATASAVGQEYSVLVCANVTTTPDPVDREVANIAAALPTARAADMRWLLPLGPREIFHDDGRRRWQIDGADQVTFLAHEAIPRPHPVSNPFTECAVFRVSGRSTFLDAPAIRSAIRLTADATPADKHTFTGYSQAAGTVTAPMILHYPYADFDDWLARATEAAAAGGHLATSFALHSRDLLQVAVAHGHLDGARPAFQAAIPCDGMIDRLIESGELFHATATNTADPARAFASAA